MVPITAINLTEAGQREVIAFPKVDEFYNLLQDRIYVVASSYILKHKITLFVNALPRRRTMFINRFENVPLVYAGIPRQRELLEGMPEEQHRELDTYWDFLDVTNLNSDTAVVSSQLYHSFNLGSYKLADIQRVGLGRLQDYFSAKLFPDRNLPPLTPRQSAEYHILKTHFNLEEDYYLSIPLVQFGEFDGIIHLVFTRADLGNVSTGGIANMIRSFSAVMETLILEWDLVGRNPEKSKAVMVTLNPEFYERINRNPILRELKFDEYYHRHLPYFKARIKFNDDIIHSKVYRPYLKTAIISIMIDSFAHNISAHSLVALNWWFKRRAENLRLQAATHRAEAAELKGIVDEYIPEGFDQDRLLELIQPVLSGVLVRDCDDPYDVVKYPGSLSREIQPLLKFLMQKGAFWSGIARDNHFGGESASLYDILWNDFVNNPLYLGTIAKSEDIHRLSLRIVEYEPYDENELRRMTPCHRPKKVANEGVWVTIDLKNKRPAADWDADQGEYLLMEDGSRLYVEEHPELARLSDFVMISPDFVKVKAILQNCQVFMPGEVVGRHAFFTLLENKIRNVKHYRGEALRSIQENGLELVLSVQPTRMQNAPADQHDLWRVGIWLNHAGPLMTDEGDILLKRLYTSLREGVMDMETFSPRLGGGYQDKICASMLFNNSFLAVQNGDESPMRDQSDDSERDAAYYPWITPSSSPVHAPHEDIELCLSVFKRWEEFTQVYDHRHGYFKKHFMLWKAADIRNVQHAEDTDFVWDNLARFRFVNIQARDVRYDRLFRQVRAQGVIRVIREVKALNSSGDSSIYKAYMHWLPGWLFNRGAFLQIRVDDAIAFRFGLQPGSRKPFVCLPAWDDSQRLPAMGEQDHWQIVNLAHGGITQDTEVLRYRNHGIYKKYFMAPVEPGEPLSDKAMSRMAELFEVLATRVAVVDNRIYSRMDDSSRLSLYERALNLFFLHEDNEIYSSARTWERSKQHILPDCHFLIIHLSFIERILVHKYGNHPDFVDENIGLFIEQEILPWVSDENGEVRDNFVVVITTGRGRTKWWSRLTSDPRYDRLTRFTMFRPVESLISAVEDAIGRQDDIELKYNLVKVLFGS